MASGQDSVIVPEDEEMGNSIAVIKDEEVESTARDVAEPAEPCEFLGHSPTYIELDKRGDVWLFVGRNKCSIAADGSHEHKPAMRFRVCSRALARASQVWEALIFGESSETKQLAISLPDDDPFALQLLLYILHGNLTPVYDLAAKEASNEPTPTFVDQVYEIVSLAHKYRMTQHLRPWASIWTELLCNKKVSYGFERLEKTLFIAHEFGSIRLYGLVSADLVWFQKGRQKLFSQSRDPNNAKRNDPTSDFSELS